MEINILLIILIIIACWRIVQGFRNGMIDEISRLISLVAALFVLSLAVMIIYGFMEENKKNVIVAVVALVILGCVFHLINFIMKSLKTLARLPVISLLNKVLGMITGLAEVIVICWIMYTVIQMFPVGEVGEQIMAWTYKSEPLMKLYETNCILPLFENL